MAGAIAGALGAKRFFLLTDVAGVLDKAGTLLTDLDRARIDVLKADATITGGMIPKVDTCLDAVDAGVEAAVILDGRIPHAMLLEIFTARGAGTLIHRYYTASPFRTAPFIDFLVSSNSFNPSQHPLMDSPPPG